MNVDPKDADRGLYKKFSVQRMDGRSLPGEKHAGCEYFVLDLTHDPHAFFALRTYAESCKRTHPALAKDLAKKLARLELQRMDRGDTGLR